MYKAFPINPTLFDMAYNNANGDLSIKFRKGQTRIYHGVEKATAYKLYYAVTQSATMSIYSNEIKKKHKVTVK